MNVFSSVTDILPDIDENDENIIDELIQKKEVGKKEKRFDNKSDVEIYLDELRSTRCYNHDLLDLVLNVYKYILKESGFAPKIFSIETSICLRYDVSGYLWRHFELVINPNHSVTWVWFSHNSYSQFPMLFGKFIIENEGSNIVFPKDIMNKFQEMNEIVDEACSLSWLKKK